MVMLPHHQMAILKELSDQPETAKSIAAKVLPNISDSKSSSASVSQTCWQLIRKGLASRTLLKRELYGYAITEAGKTLLSQKG